MRKFSVLVWLALACLCLGVTLAPAATAATTGNVDPQTGRIVSDDPAGFTPHVLDGTVYSITQVGNTMVVGGSFTQVQNTGGAVLNRSNLFAFDATTGAISTTFTPNPNGIVYKVQQTNDASSVYVGGNFTATAGVARKNLYRADLTTGAPVSTFVTPALTGQVRDIDVIGNRMWIAGKFTHIAGRAQLGLGTINATTGAYDPYFTGVFSGLHRTGVAGDVTSVLRIATNTAGTQLVATGNFTKVNGLARSQIARIDISGASYALAGWTTNLFTSACSAKFESYVTDVEFSPNGDYFAVSTTGAYGGYNSAVSGNGCDVVARFETSSTAAGTLPTWTAYTGGDTTWTIEVTDNVIYAGGHQSWQNNPLGNNVPAQGAVDRPGIAALNPVNGMAYSWNPSRTRGVGVQDMLATGQGLWVGSDTDRIGAYEYHARIALLPLSTGKTLPATSRATLPASVYTVPTGTTQLTRRSFTGTTATTRVNAPNGSVAWGTTVGAFVLDGTLYTAASDGAVTRRSFDGTTYGPPSDVDAADQLVRQTDWHNTDIPTMTSLFYYEGRIYFTRSGQTALFSRGFEPESDIVGQQLYSTPSVTGVAYAGVRGAFVADDKLYFANATGQLFRASWSGRAAVTGTAVQVSGPGKDTQNWASQAMFANTEVAPPANVAPTAAATVTCDQLTCTFNGTASADSDGTISSYAWDFGDGDTGTGATTTHTYATAGQRTVTLEVTDDDGASDTTTRTISPNDAAAPIDFVASNGTVGNRTNHDVTIPPGVQAGDALVLMLAANNAGATYATPSGWTQIQSVDGASIRGRAWSRVATAADAGTNVRVVSSDYAKSDLTVAAYRGTDSTTPIAVSGSRVDNTAGSAHTSPTVDVPAGDNRLLTYWADKSGDTSGWTTPSGQTLRNTESGTGGGHVSAVLTDSNAAVSGTAGGLTATANGASTSGVSFSIALEPGRSTPPPPPPPPANEPPTATAAVSCADLTCTFDAAGSGDTDGTVAGYAWTFGDGDNGTGATTTHTYATAGPRTVTLTVTDDDGASTTVERTANPTDPPVDPPPATDPIAFVAAAVTGGNRTSHAVTIPATVEAGDALVLFLSANNAAPTYTGPNGWTPVASAGGSNVVARAWSRVATATDPGSSVVVTSSALAKSDLTVVAYSGTSATDPVASAAARLDTAAGAGHTSPAVTAPAGANWLVTYWSDKSGATTGWTKPASQTQRSTLSGTGGGHMSSLLTDSGADVAGPTGSLTATANSASSGGASFSVVLH